MSRRRPRPFSGESLRQLKGILGVGYERVVGILLYEVLLTDSRSAVMIFSGSRSVLSGFV